MLQSSLIEFLIIVVLIVANGFFAASEIAIVSARRGRLEQQAAKGRRGARTALKLGAEPNRFLSTVQVGITLIGTFAAAFGGANFARILEQALRDVPVLAPYASSIALGSVVMVISYLTLIIGELVPKRLALQSAESIAMTVAPAMQLLSRVASPVVSFLSFSTTVVLRLLRRHDVAETPITEEDIIALVREGAAEGTVEAAEQELIKSVFSFTERTVRSLMTPRTQVVAVDINTSFDQVVQSILESGYSRIPVFQDTLDNIIGVLNVKDLLRTWGQTQSVDLRTLLRQPIYLLEHQRATVAFQQLKQQRSTLAIVLDEYAQVAGVISVEDLLEGLVGDLVDEYDEVETVFIRRDDGSYLVDGLMSFADLHERIALPKGDELQDRRAFETVAGFVLSVMGRIPNVGDKAEWEGYTIEVMDMDQRRIDKVLIVPPASADQVASTPQP